MRILLLLFSLFPVPDFTYALKILGLFPHPAVSHFKFFHPIMRQLAESGHNVDVLSPFLDEQPLPLYTDYRLPGDSLSNAMDFNFGFRLFSKYSNWSDREDFVLSGGIPVAIFWIFKMFERHQLTFLMPYFEFFFLHAYGKDTCNKTINSESLAQILFQHPAGYYDIILVEQFNTDCMMGVAYQLAAPVVALSSCALMPWHYERMGAPIIPSYMSALFVGQSQPMSFGGRLGNWITTHTLNWLYKLFSVPAADALLRLRFGPGIPSTGQLVKNTSLMLINQHFSLSGPKPLPPNVIEVGGLHIAKAKPLNDALQQLLDNAEHGAILISWGSQLRASSLDSAKREGLLRALARLKQQIIWKWDNETLAEQPANVHIMKWLPQRDILAHPKVSVFFTNGGLLGITEAVSCGVPIVGMPIFGDQYLNVADLVQRGMAVHLDFERLSEQSAFEALSNALVDRYKLSAQRIAAAYNDRPQKPLETATWWVEHVAETRGAPLLQPSAVHLNRFIYHSLDIYLAVLSVLLLLLASGIGLWRLCYGHKRSKPLTQLKHKRN